MKWLEWRGVTCEEEIEMIIPYLMGSSCSLNTEISETARRVRLVSECVLVCAGL